MQKNKKHNKNRRGVVNWNTFLMKVFVMFQLSDNITIWLVYLIIYHSDVCNAQLKCHSGVENSKGMSKKNPLDSSNSYAFPYSLSQSSVNDKKD